MAGRAAARATAMRDLPSSPPKSGRRVNRPKSPTKPTGRTTRSASRELDEPEPSDMRAKRIKRSRAVREGSADSHGSAASAEGIGGRKRKNLRVPSVVAEELSMVQKEREHEHISEPANNGNKNTQSPGGMSNLSGTTARTSQSEQRMADLDTGMIVELIPDLSREAFQLLDLLAPSRASPTLVEAVIKELQVPGSGRGKRLRLREKTFESTKENYSGELWVDPALILRKLFGDQELSPGNFRPDVIFHLANIATFVKELLVAQRDNPNTRYLLQRMDDVFPTPFLSGYEKDPRFGTSALLGLTLKLALDIRTQTSIAVFKECRDERNFDPDELLAALFYEPPAQNDETLTRYEDLVRNGTCKDLGGISAEALPLHDQADEILKRVESIREAFNVEGNGSMDYVDFDKLHDRFSWTEFLTNIVAWCQLRRDEINKNIESQGGIDNIRELLVETVKGSDSQIELYYEPPKTGRPSEVAKGKNSLLPAATIIPASAGKSLYSSRSLSALLKRSAPNFIAPPSNQQHPAAPLHRSAEHQPSIPQIDVGSNHALLSEEVVSPDDDPTRSDNDITADDGSASIEEVMFLYNEGEKYNHKENRPVNRSDNQKLRFVDRQPNAQRVIWSQDRDDAELRTSSTRNAKRSSQSMEEDFEDDEQEEEPFETDHRPVDKSRRNQPSAKRSRVEFRDGDGEDPMATTEAQSQRKQAQQGGSQDSTEVLTQDNGPLQRSLQDEALQSSAQAADDAPPSSSYAFVQETARAAMLRHRPHREQQPRQKWSIAESDALIDLIDIYGCGWSTILKMGRGKFAHTRDQVALKDKARNMKVELLIAGSMLPNNFNGVALGKKEKEKVKANHMNPYRLEGEMPGEEVYDMDGNLL